MRGRGGLSQVVSTLLLILIALVAIAIIWVVISSILKGGTQQLQVQTSAVVLEIKSAQVQQGNNITVTVKRDAGAGNFTAIDFVFSNKTTSKTVRQNASMQELQTQIFTFNLTGMNTSTLTSVTVVPVLVTSTGQEALGTASTFNIGSPENQVNNNENPGSPDTTPPVILSSTPSNNTILPAGTTNITLSIFTDENATCRYSPSPGIAYGSMIYAFNDAGLTTHTTIISAFDKWKFIQLLHKMQ